jgi:hypothetical protein
MNNRRNGSNVAVGVKISALALSLGTAIGIAALGGSVASAQSTGLQNAEKLVSEGVAGDADAKRRAPVLTVSVERTSGGVKLLADAFQISPEFREYPIRFEFFVNRQLFATQYRSPGLDGPVGVDVGPDSGTPPFNFSVIATVVHPNRSFSSAVEGAVFAANLITTFESCTLTQSVGADDATIYVGEKVVTTQSGNNQVALSFTGKSEDGEQEITIAGAFTVNGEKSEGTVTTTDEAADSTTTAVEGTATSDATSLSELDLSSTDGTLTVKCS